MGLRAGAHSHVRGVRWWNVKNPGRYSELVLSGQSPVQESETLSAEHRRVEQTMLSVRVRETLPASAATVAAAHGWLQDGELTVRGRLMADAVVREVLGW